MIRHYPKDWIKRASAHYCHAVEKHPHFTDTLMPDTATPRTIGNWLMDCRRELKGEIRNRRVNALAVFECEVAEACAEVLKENNARAVEEIYDAIAVLMRMADEVERGGEAAERSSGRHDGRGGRWETTGRGGPVATRRGGPVATRRGGGVATERGGGVGTRERRRG